MVKITKKHPATRPSIPSIKFEKFISETPNKIKKGTIEYFYDTTSFKINKYLPGTKIKIKKYKELSKKDADYVFLGAWNFKDEIFKKEKKFIKNGGKFITHIPIPKVL